jgi:hypothetical protein
MMRAFEAMQKQIRSLTKRQDETDAEAKKRTKMFEQIERVSKAAKAANEEQKLRSAAGRAAVTEEEHKTKSAAGREAAQTKATTNGVHASNDRQTMRVERDAHKRADHDPHDDSGLSLRSDVSPSAERHPRKAENSFGPPTTDASGAQAIKRPLSARLEERDGPPIEGRKRLRYDTASLEEGEHPPERVETLQDRMKRIGDAAERRANNQRLWERRAAQEAQEDADRREAAQRRKEMDRREELERREAVERRETQERRALAPRGEVTPRGAVAERREEVDRREAMERHQLLLASNDRNSMHPANRPSDHLSIIGRWWDDRISNEWRLHDLLSSCTAHTIGQRNLKIFFDPREPHSIATAQLESELRTDMKKSRVNARKDRLRLEFPRGITHAGSSIGPSITLDAMVSIAQGLTGRAGTPDVVLGRDL